VDKKVHVEGVEKRVGCWTVYSVGFSLSLPTVFQCFFYELGPLLRSVLALF
jgi:hypothetical protein